MTIEDVLDSFDDKVFDHEHRGHPAGGEILTLRCEQYDLVLFFQKRQLVAGNKWTSGKVKHYPLSILMSLVQGLLNQAA